MFRPPQHAFRRAFVIGLALSLAACGATRGYGRGATESGFLGNYSKLEPREGYDSQEVYINPNAHWGLYDSVMIDSVSLWITGESERELSDEDRQMLTDTIFKAMHEALGKYFVVVDRPAPSAVRIRIALTEVKGANVATRTLTTVVPQLRLVSTIAGLSADVASTVGTATVEIEVLDSVTGVRLAAAVDSRAGNKALFSGRTFQKWGDFEAAAQHWSGRAAFRLAKFGVQRKPGAPMPEED